MNQVINKDKKLYPETFEGGRTDEIDHVLAVPV